MNSAEYKRPAVVGGITAALGILAEMADGAIVHSNVDFTTAVGTAPTLEFNPQTGDAAHFSSSFQFSVPSLNQAIGIYYECQSLLNLFTPGYSTITDVDAVVSSGTSLALLTPGQTVSAASVFNDSTDASYLINYSLASQDLYVGYRFLQSGEAGYNYGYCTFLLTNVGTDAQITLKSIAYESAVGTGIEVGAVPEPATASLLLLAAFGAWLARHFFRRYL